MRFAAHRGRTITAATGCDEHCDAIVKRHASAIVGNFEWSASSFTEAQDRRSSGVEDVNETSTATAGKANNAVALCEDRVVLAHASAVAALEAGTALSNENGSTSDQLAVKSLDAKSLCLGVATVARRTLTLLMCHVLVLLKTSCAKAS
jgi:hypothetical protein